MFVPAEIVQWRPVFDLAFDLVRFMAWFLAGFLLAALFLVEVLAEDKGDIRGVITVRQIVWMFDPPPIRN